MTKLKKIFAIAAIALAFGSPAAASPDEVVISTIDHRVAALETEISSLKNRYQNASASSRGIIKKQIVGLIARKSQLGMARHTVPRLPEYNNRYIIAFCNWNVASPADYRYGHRDRRGHKKNRRNNRNWRGYGW